MIPDVSVVICTYNREASLRQILLDVLDQDSAPCEILVVDQTPAHEGETLELLRNPRITRIVQEVPNLPAARNLGISRATGDVILFVDDDLRIPPHLVRYLRDSFSDARVHGLAPEVIPDDEGNLEDILQVPSEYHRGGAVRRVKSVIGACMAIRREAILEVGGFDERLGRLNRSASGEDLEFTRKLVRHGFTLWLSKVCRVLHHDKTPGGCETRVGRFAGHTDHHRRALVYILLKENNSLVRFRWPVLLRCLRPFVLRRDVIRGNQIWSALRSLSDDIRTVRQFCADDARNFPENSAFTKSIQ